MKDITPSDSVVPVFLVPPSKEEIAERESWAASDYQRKLDFVKLMRQSAYQQSADPLFFKYQAGEATEQEWLDARAAVVEQDPYPS